MNDRDTKKTIEGIRTLRKEHKKSPEKARAFLTKAGILTKGGKLSDRYKQGA